MYLNFLEGGIRMPYNAFGCWKILFGCLRGAFGYAGIQTFNCWAKGIQMLRGGIWMLEVVFRYPIRVFEYAGYKT